MKTKKILLATMSMIIIVSVVILTIGLSVSAASYDTGFKSPTANAAGATGDGNGFESSPTNAYADDGAVAFDLDSGTAASAVCADAVRETHSFYNFAFGVPGGSTIDGIEVRLDAKVDKKLNSAAMCAQLSWDGGATWTAAKTTPALTATEVTYLLGGATDKWGRTWTTADLSDANFRLRLSNTATSAIRDYSLDYAAVKVYYSDAVAPTNTPPPVTPTAGPSPTPTSVPSSYRKVGYFVQWGIYARDYLVKNLHTSGSAGKTTFINYAFTNITDAAPYACVSGDEFADYNKAFDATESVDGVADGTSGTVLRGNFNQLRKLKLMYPNLKVLISVGGWSWSSNFSDAALPENRATFAANCIDMFLKGNFTPILQGYSDVFDGIDLDWEYPAACGLTCDYRPEDTQNFTALLSEFRTQMNALSAQTGKTYYLTIAAPAGESYFSKIELGNIAPTLDFINIMGYDFHGAFESPLVTNLHAPLYGTTEDPTYSQDLWVDHAVQHYLAAGVPANKIVIGVPFYGRGWAGVPAGDYNGLYQLAGRCARGKYECGIDDYKGVIGVSGCTEYVHPVAQSAWCYTGSTLWTYDSPASMALKMNYIKNLGLGGAMWWEFSGDTTNTVLLNAVYNGLQ